MKQKLSHLFQENTIRMLLRFYLVIIFGYLVIGVWKWRNLPPELPLFYSLPRGNEQLGTPLTLLILPIFSLLLFTLNAIIASMIFERAKLAAQILVLAGLIASIMLFVAFVKIIFLIA